VADRKHGFESSWGHQAESQSFTGLLAKFDSAVRDLGKPRKSPESPLGSGNEMATLESIPLDFYGRQLLHLCRRYTMEQRTDIVKVRLASNQVIHVEAEVIGGDQEIAGAIPAFEGVTEAIEGIAKALAGTLSRVSPTKAAVEFGLAIALESGKLTALFVKGGGNASVKITLEWGAKAT
jgi:Trypsin-co-occurring domain 1